MRVDRILRLTSTGAITPEEGAEILELMRVKRREGTRHLIANVLCFLALLSYVLLHWFAYPA